jgi:hypothetical protein
VVTWGPNPGPNPLSKHPKVPRAAECVQLVKTTRLPFNRSSVDEHRRALRFVGETEEFEIGFPRLHDRA